MKIKVTATIMTTTLHAGRWMLKTLSMCSPYMLLLFIFVSFPSDITDTLEPAATRMESITISSRRTFA